MADAEYGKGIVHNIIRDLHRGFRQFRFSWYESDENAFHLIRSHFPKWRFFLYSTSANIENKTIELDFIGGGEFENGAAHGAERADAASQSTAALL